MHQVVHETIIESTKVIRAAISLDCVKSEAKRHPLPRYGVHSRSALLLHHGIRDPDCDGRFAGGKREGCSLKYGRGRVTKPGGEECYLMLDGMGMTFGINASSAIRMLASSRRCWVPSGTD